MEGGQRGLYSSHSIFKSDTGDKQMPDKRGHRLKFNLPSDSDKQRNRSQAQISVSNKEKHDFRQNKVKITNQNYYN